MALATGAVEKGEKSCVSTVSRRMKVKTSAFSSVYCHSASEGVYVKCSLRDASNANQLQLTRKLKRRECIRSLLKRLVQTKTILRKISTNVTVSNTRNKP
ncbi:hypothetical protein H6P81_009138 [Aristolochia fimbriata]|uniref:Uncharacterized protein n=1 Tax=Aristolochia fimbriata TaxID=158543 RepID=A0AAV7EK73_ARIFI|nr:hypothetical protein H6P81_009138 [Aristolochia fimbriata]